MTSRWSDYAANKIADVMRGLPWAQPANLYFGLASAATAASSAELSGTGYARQPVARNMAAWTPTHGGSAPVASSGTTHMIVNRVAVDFGTAGSPWGVLNYVELWDAVNGGNRICYIPVTFGAVNNGTGVIFASGSLALTLGLAGGCSDYLANKFLDLFFRGVAYSWPEQTFLALCTAAPTNAAGGTEVPSVGSYARAAIPSSTSAWSATQGSGTVGLSSGSSGVISNNSPITFPKPDADWGTITHDKQMDAATGGNVLLFGALDSPKTVLADSAAPSYGSDNYKITIN